MTVVISDYPRKHLGQVADVSGLTADGPWMAVREAIRLTGARGDLLARWEEEGVISVLQEFERSPRLYLRREMEVLARLKKAGPPPLAQIRRYVQDRRTAARDQVVIEPLQDAELATHITTLVNMARGQHMTARVISEPRVRLTQGVDSRGVEIVCRRRPSDGDRWWWTWGGSVWLCEAVDPTQVLVHAKGALRKVGKQ